MHLTRKDVAATWWVGAATVFYGLWLTGTVAADMSTRVAATIVLALGFLGCTSDVEGMKTVFGIEGEARSPMLYVVVSTLMGTVALVAGILAITAASEAMLATLVAAMVVLWLMSTMRHAIAKPMRLTEDRTIAPVGKAA